MAADNCLSITKRKRGDRDAASDVESGGEIDGLQRLQKKAKGQDLGAVSKNMNGNEAQRVRSKENTELLRQGFEDQRVQERFTFAKSEVEGWNQCYADIDLSDISSVDTIICRLELGLCECDCERRKEKATLPNSDDHQYSKLYIKIAYELGQLKRQRKLLVSQSLKPQPLLQDLVDRRVHYDAELRFNPDKDVKRADRTTVCVSTSLSHAWGMHKDEREELERLFNVKTLDGAARAIVWLKEQMGMLYRSPRHSQPASPYRVKKSRYLEQVQELLEEWQAEHLKLEQRLEKRALAEYPDETRRILQAMARTDYTGFESSLEVVDKRTNIQTTYPHWSRPAPLDIKKPFPTTYFEKLTYTAALVLRPDKIMRYNDARDGYAFETAKYKYRVFAFEDDKDRAKVDPVSNEAYVKIKREASDEDGADMVDRDVLGGGGSSEQVAEGSTNTRKYWDLRPSSAAGGTYGATSMASTPEYVPPVADAGCNSSHGRARGSNQRVYHPQTGASRTYAPRSRAAVVLPQPRLPPPPSALPRASNSTQHFNPVQLTTPRSNAPGTRAATRLPQAHLLPPKPSHPHANTSTQHVNPPQTGAPGANAPRIHGAVGQWQAHPLPPRPALVVPMGPSRRNQKGRWGAPSK